MYLTGIVTAATLTFDSYPVRNFISMDFWRTPSLLPSAAERIIYKWKRIDLPRRTKGTIEYINFTAVMETCLLVTLTFFLFSIGHIFLAFNFQKLTGLKWMGIDTTQSAGRNEKYWSCLRLWIISVAQLSKELLWRCYCASVTQPSPFGLHVPQWKEGPGCRPWF